MIDADRIVARIGTLATLDGGPVPRTGAAMREVGERADAAVAIRGGRIAWVGPMGRLGRAVRLRRGGERIDAENGLVVPGFVDAHSHALFAGDRAFELPWKVAGVPYAEIARRGGGIRATVAATRRASDRTLAAETAARLRALEEGGATTIEVKTGYGLAHREELRLLRLLRAIGLRGGFDLVPTYLGAHAVPGRGPAAARRYVQEIVTRTLPAVGRGRLARFCDVFCEPGYFSVADAERILRAALAAGLGLKVHAEEFVWSGGARLAARLGARSAEHLLRATPDDARRLARAGVTAVLLPTTPFTTPGAARPPGRMLVDRGVPVALGSDCSPNSYVTSMGLVLSHAVYGAGLEPREALTAATVNAAWAVDAADRAGMVAVGRPADLVLFDLASVEEIPYRIGARPAQVLRQGIPRSPSRVEPHN
ncbi:MAG: imidazolonepropionase [Thermoplasmata archaeon]